jgi:hypothetical protein
MTDVTTQKDIHIDSKELVFNKNNDIQSGGFSVTDIMNKAGISPIMTMNVNNDVQSGGTSDKVSDLFQHLAVPSWATMYNIHGGEYKRKGWKGDDKSDSDSDNSDIDDDLHDKLLELVREHENKLKSKPKKSKRNKKNEKNNTTKKIKKIKK